MHSQPSCDVFHNPDSNCNFYFFMRGLCVVYMWLEQTSVNENTTNLECELYLCLALAWRWSDVHLASIFTRWKTLTILNMQKICADVDAHNKWIRFIRRSRQIINGFWRTPSERTDQNFSFFVRWTCVMVCVTGPLYPSHTTHRARLEWQKLEQCIVVRPWIILGYEKSQRVQDEYTSSYK